VLEITVPEQPTEQHMPTASDLTVAKTTVHPETSATLNASVNALGDKYAFSYCLVLYKVTDEIVCNTNMPTLAELVLNILHEITPQSVAIQSNVKEGNDCENADWNILAFDKNTNEFVSNNGTPKEVAPKLQLQLEIVPHSVVV
jgi:hypothetical protein